ncbi:MAG: hypothetical protein NXI22_24510, partial [bacterium]|nr:hypothetical protein [bacterium]
MTRSVKIPPGVDDQMNVALPGEGCPSLKGDPPGDLVCSIQLQPHPFWRRYGSQLSTRYSITYSQAVLGAELELPTLSGPEAFKIPPGTAADQAFRIRNRGMPDPNGGPPGDLTIETFLEVPTRISREYKTLLQRIAEIEQPKIARRRNAPLQQVEKPVSGCDSADPKREDNQQHFRLPISYTEAVLGARVDLPSFAGAKSIKIPAGTQNGRVFRIRSKGMNDPNG